MWGYCSRADGVREAERNVAGNAGTSSVCKKKNTLQHFSSLTSLTSFPNTHGVLSKCRVVVSESLALPQEL